jgi:creatinine amidohydrolase
MSAAAAATDHQSSDMTPAPGPDRNQSRPRRLRELSPGRVAATIAEDPRLIVPIGTCEAHGPHLPLGCDTIIVERLADDLSAEFGVLRAPAIEYGVNAETAHPSPGNGSVRKKTLHAVLNDLLASWEATGVREFILLTAHAHEAHQEALATVITTEARVRVVDIFAVHIADLLTGQAEALHGDEVDTSLLLYLAPELVNMRLAQDYSLSPADQRRHRRGLGPRQDAVVGRATLATADTGRALYTRIRDRVAMRIMEPPPSS